ncbi:hypothetical protein M0804_014010 [Polistes exclamans]|nr:hypothetical protein M0804_014010 [Polistes exclamans]
MLKGDAKLGQEEQEGQEEEEEDEEERNNNWTDTLTSSDDKEGEEEEEEEDRKEGVRVMLMLMVVVVEVIVVVVVAVVVVVVVTKGRSHFSQKFLVIEATVARIATCLIADVGQNRVTYENDFSEKSLPQNSEIFMGRWKGLTENNKQNKRLAFRAKLCVSYSAAPHCPSGEEPFCLRGIL